LPHIILQSDIAPFVLIGMGGFFAGVAKTPISSLLMVSEMTGSYGLLPPLMLVNAITFIVSGKRSIYSKQKKNRMDSPAHSKDYFIEPLKKYSVKDIMEEENYAKSIKPEATLYEMITIFFNSSFTIHPVVAIDGKIIGFVKYDTIKNMMMNTPDDSRLAKDIMETKKIPKIKITETLDIVVHNFFRKKTDELFVIDGKTEKYVGIVRKRDVLLVINRAEKTFKSNK
jgi:CIC family chloride channel protein